MEEEPAADGDGIGAGGIKAGLPKEMGEGLNERDGDPDVGMDLADDWVDPPRGVQAKMALHAEEGAAFG